MKVCWAIGHDWKHLGRRVGTIQDEGISYEYDGPFKYECRRCGEQEADWPRVRPFYRAFWMFASKFASDWWFHASSASHPKRRRSGSAVSVHWYGNAPWTVWLVEVFVMAPLFSFYQAWAGTIHINGYGPFWPADLACRAHTWLYDHYADPRTQMWAFKDLRDGDYDGWLTVPYWWPAGRSLPDPAPRMRIRHTEAPNPDEMTEPGTYNSGSAVEVEVFNPHPDVRWGTAADRADGYGLPLANAMAASPFKEPA